jgi:ubiquinone biosynthesis protein UbiJ
MNQIFLQGHFQFPILGSIEEDLISVRAAQAQNADCQLNIIASAFARCSLVDMASAVASNPRMTFGCAPAGRRD